MIYFPDRLMLEDAGMQGSSRLFRVTHRYRYLSSLGVIEVPAGTLTDGASIPRAFWATFAPYGEFFPAAVIHDFLYSEQNDRFDRWDSDGLFKEALFNMGLPWYQREMVYRAVRLFGASSFKGANKTP